MAGTTDRPARKQAWFAVVPVALVAAAIPAICLVAPTEATMGDAQRILYVHVSVAWFGLVGFLVMAGTGLAYLVGRDLRWDHWSQAAAEVGWLCCALTLVTGSFWAHSAWGVWWTWDPRLTTSFVLWAIYSGCLIVRGSLEDPHQRARVGAVLAVLGMLDIPLVVLATRWFRSIHPASPEMEPAMRGVLLLSVVAFTWFFGLLVARRRNQLQSERLLDKLEPKIEI
jgi:heme exporter protein C